MASSPWVLRVVPVGDQEQWDVVQARTGRTLDTAATQDLAVERALAWLPTGGSVQVVIDGFVVRQEVVVPPREPRRTAVITYATSLASGVLVLLVLGGLFHASVLITLLGAVTAMNAVHLVRRAAAIRRTGARRGDPSLVGPASAEDRRDEPGSSS